MPLTINLMPSRVYCGNFHTLNIRHLFKYDQQNLTVPIDEEFEIPENATVGQACDLIIKKFKSLKKSIKEAELKEIQEYNQHIKDKAEQARKKEEEKRQAEIEQASALKRDAFWRSMGVG